jgi:hypothetical protein
VKGYSSSPLRPDRLWCPPSLLSWVPGVKRPGREADQSPPSSTEVKNAWSCACTASRVFMAWYLIKKREHLHGMVLS